MRRFTTLAELDAHVADNPYPRLLVTSARERMRAVEECNEGGANAVLIFTDNPDEAVAVGAEYHLGQSLPEDYCFFGWEGQVWFETVYVLGDDGSGVVLYTKLYQR